MTDKKNNSFTKIMGAKHNTLKAEEIDLRLDELQQDIEELNKLWQLLIEQYEKGYREGFLRSITALLYNITIDLNNLNCNFRELQTDYFHMREYVINNASCLAYRKAHKKKLIEEYKQIAIQRYLEELRANNGEFVEENEIC